MGMISEQTKNTAVAKKSEAQMMKGYLDQMMPEIKRALPSVMTGERFSRMVTTAMSANPQLTKCTPKSFIGAVLQAAQLGVEPNTPLGQAYLIPYSNKGTMEVQFQLGYKGIIDLAYRSGEVSIIQSHIVYENDKFEVAYGLDPKLVHEPAMKDRGEAIAVYATFKTKDGGFGFEVMSMDDVKNHAEKYSKAFKSSYSPWATNFEEMAKKTVLKKVLKYAPLKTEFVREVATDETIKSAIVPDMMNEQDETVYEAEYKEVTPEVTKDGNEQ